MRRTHPTATLLLAAALFAAALAARSQSVPDFSLIVSPPLPTAGERVTVSVLASNFEVASTTFTWFRDDAPLAAASGLGRSSLTMATDPDTAGAIEVRVEANPGAGFARATGRVTVLTLPGTGQTEKAASGLASDFTFEVSPQSPDAGETVSAEVVTFAFDRAAAAYQWYVNGALQRGDSGRGRFRFTFAAGPEGTSRIIRVDLTTPAGEVRSNSASVETASVPLYWWADTTVPHWYRGKALPTRGARVTVLALPAGRNASDLTYQWRLNDDVMSASSGVGRQTFAARLEFPVEERITLTVRDPAGGLAKSVAITVRPTQPLVGIYEMRPARGIIFERQLSSFSAPSGEPYDFAAVPFFFARERATNLRYLWRLDNEAIGGEFARPWLFTVESDAGQTAQGRLDVDILDPARAGVRAAAGLEATFR